MSVDAPATIDPDIEQAARRLRLRVAALAGRGLPGQHAALGPGRGGDPYDARPYAPGDPVRDVDWRLLARSGRPFVRQRSGERRMRLALLLDRSKSMAALPSKAETAALLAGLLAWVAWASGDSVRLYPHDVSTRDACWRALAGASDQAGASLADGLAAVRGADAVVAIGDAFEPTAALASAMARSAAGGRPAVLVTVRRPEELSLAVRSGAVRAADPESSRPRLVDAARTCARFAEALEAQQAALRSASARGRWAWVRADGPERVVPTADRVLRALARG